jgi:hypothetical protein
MGEFLLGGRAGFSQQFAEADPARTRCCAQMQMTARCKDVRRARKIIGKKEAHPDTVVIVAAVLKRWGPCLPRRE